MTKKLRRRSGLYKALLLACCYHASTTTPKASSFSASSSSFSLETSSSSSSSSSRIRRRGTTASYGGDCSEAVPCWANRDGYGRRRRREFSSLRRLPPSPFLPPLRAKPPPASSFDLDAIEAYEEELMTTAAGEGEESGSGGGGDAPEGDGVGIFGDGDQAANAMAKKYVVPPELDNKRVDAVIAALEPELSRSYCGNLVADGCVSLVGIAAASADSPEEGEGEVIVDRKSFKLQKGQEIRVRFPREEKPPEVVAQDLPLDILYEDEHMVVINKAASMVVHPAAGNWDGTVVNALAYHLSHNTRHGSGDFIDPDTGGVLAEAAAAAGAESVPVEGTDGEISGVSFRPGIVHRLDKGTTGVLVVAKTTAALAALSKAFADREVKKTYLAITVGNPGSRVKIDKAIGRHPIHRQRMRVVPEIQNQRRGRVALPAEAASKGSAGRRALSYVDTLAFDGKLSLVKVRIATGRTHQIRVHLQDRHTPIYGDDVYGLPDWNRRLSKRHGIRRPLLHAQRLEIRHPVTGDLMTFAAEMPDDMAKVARTICPEGDESIPSGIFPQASGDGDDY